jgi:uncharacterized protein
MIEKVGRNDPCPCGSGKKYKNCCLQKEQQQKRSPLGGRKFTAKVLSAGGINKSQQEVPQRGQIKAVDYTTLMERSFGQALHLHEDKPPVPPNPSEYLVQDELKEEK